MALQYNPLRNNFTIYQDIEPVKRSVVLPLFDTPVDVSSWTEKVTDDGIPIASNLFTSKRTVNNPEERNPIPTSEQPISNSEERNLNEQQDVSIYTNNTKYNRSDKATYAKNFFINKGLSPHAAAGIVGNLILESSLNTSIKGDGGLAFGIAQWHPDRLRGLKTLATNRGTSINDLDTLLEYIWYELNTGYKKALNGLRNSKNVDEATEAFMLHYEKPGKPHFEKRLEYAKSLS